MTTLTFNSRVCRMCSAKSTYEEISSTNQFGSVDLDLRPPEMMRSTMRLWVQECTNCEYIYETVDKGQLSRTQFEELKQRSRWLDIATFSSNLQICNRFAKYALILESENQSPSKISQQFLRAAWDADDELKDDVAKVMRTEAAIYLAKASEELGPVDERNNRNFLLLDILRRSGRFDECIRIIAQLKFEKFEGILKSLLHFQASLVADRDMRAHELSKIYSVMTSAQGTSEEAGN